MPLPVSLKKVAQEIDGSIEGHVAFIHRKTGRIYAGDVGLSEPEPGDKELPAWAREAGAKIRKAAASEDWLPLPDELRCETVTEVERFCKAWCVGKERRELLGHIRSGMKIGVLKGKLYEMGLYQDWEEHRLERIAKLAAKWLTEMGIAYRD
jgi:hypothetical protein